MFDKIVNPETGRKVSIYGKIGKKVLKNYLNSLNGGSEGKEDTVEEVRLDDGEPFEFYQTIEEVPTTYIGEEWNVGEMPLGAWVTYRNKLYRLDKYDNNTGRFIVSNNYGVNSIDATDNAIYWGEWENVPE